MFEDEGLEAVDDLYGAGEVSSPETPFQTADEGEEDKSLSPAPDAEQLNAPDETTRDEAFKTETVVKDYKSWQRINQEVAEFTGKTVDEIKALPFEERMSLLATERQSLTAKLESLSEFENFVGIKVDQPADRWNVGEQLNSLPENHFNKLVDTVMVDHLPTFVDELLADPQSHPDEFKLMLGVTTKYAEAAYDRPLAEIDSIMGMVQGLSPEQVYQMMQGQGGQGQQPSYSPVAQPTSPQSGSAYLLAEANTARNHAQKLIEAGYEPESAEVAAWENQEKSLRYAANYAAQQERNQQAIQQRIADVEGRVAKSSESEAQKTARAIDEQYEKQSVAARNGALDSVVKGRVPEELMADVRELIDARAEKAIKADTKASDALALAKDFEKDGLAVKAKGYMAVYAARVSTAYREAGSFVLNKFVVPQARSLSATDKQKAARKEIGLTGNGRPNAATPTPLNGGQPLRDEDVGAAALAYYRAQNQ